MTKHNVLLVCGSGASSGFMAANIRKAAKSRGIDMEVRARSGAALEDYIDEIDCLMIGPHFKSLRGQLESKCEGHDIKIDVISQEAYARLNGDKALDQILALFEEQ